MKKYLILDCYVDEPACLGVPPFISPYPRYIYGALISGGVEPQSIDYLTIDDLRFTEYSIQKDYTFIFLIGGSSVPGKYLGSKIGTRTEIEKIISNNSHHKFAIGGLISSVLSGNFDNAVPVKNDIEKYASGYVNGNPTDGIRSSDEIALWSRLGARVIKTHHRFPDIICEIETSRGCPRLNHCSFCSEGLFAKIEFREPEHILMEIESLIEAGASRFRIGRQADIIQYKSALSDFKNGFPRPNPSAIINLFSPLKKMVSEGKISILNVDNGNPGSIFNFPDESSIILSEIAQTVTPGDTLPFGVESFDPAVVSANNLKVSEDEAFFAVKLLNEIGSFRKDGIPVLLPGINLIHGLKGETDTTFEKNYRALSRILDAGLLLKRINIRKFQEYPGTPAENFKFKSGRGVENRFKYYKEKIRDDIDTAMLRKIYPPGTIIKNIQILDNKGGFSYGKQIASYSITVKFPMELSDKKFYDGLIVDYNERSLTALPYPADFLTLPRKALEIIPGISKKTASDIILKRPDISKLEISELLKFTDKKISEKFF